MSEWKEYYLGELADFSNGINFDKDAYKHGIRIIGVSDFGNRFYPDYESLREVSSDSVPGRALLEDGDVVFVRSNGNKQLIGRSLLISKAECPVTYSGFCIRARLKDLDTCDPLFFAYYYKSRAFRADVTGSAAGTNIQNLNQGTLSRHKMTLPPIEVQKKIAGILSAYDELIENNRKQIKLLEEAAQRLYKEWFIDLGFPGYEAVSVDPETGLPDGWKSVCLADIVSKVTTGLNPRKNFVLGQGSNYYVTIKNMSSNDVYLDDRCDRVDDEAIELINRRSDLQFGDVLFSAVGTIGRVCLVSIPLGNWNVNESIFTLRANELVSKEFLYLLLLSFDLQQYCKANSHGVAQPGIRMADLKQFELKLPDVALMREFTAIVSPLIELAQSLKENAKRLQEARDRLLPKLMSGEIEVG